MLPASANHLREEESGDHRQYESKRFHYGADVGIQGRDKRDGHDSVLHHLRPACGTDRSPGEVDGRLLRGAERHYHETRQHHCDMVSGRVTTYFHATSDS